MSKHVILFMLALYAGGACLLCSHDPSLCNFFFFLALLMVHVHNGIMSYVCTYMCIATFTGIACVWLHEYVHCISPTKVCA